MTCSAEPSTLNLCPTLNPCLPGPLLQVLPKTPATERYFGEAEFRAMKNSAVFVNLGRGESVDEPAMVAALQAGAAAEAEAGPEGLPAGATDPGQLLIAGAGLDVTEEEPLPQPSALWSLPNVVLTPHCAPHTPDFAVGSAQVFMRNLERYCAGAEAGLENVVDVDQGY